MSNGLLSLPEPAARRAAKAPVVIDLRTKGMRRWAVARVGVSKLAPYFTNTLFKLIYKDEPSVPRTAISEEFVMYWNAEFLDTIEDPQVIYQLFHELLHVVKQHFRRARAIGATPPKSLPASQWTPLQRENAHLVNIAGDCEINEDLEELGIVIPEGRPLPSRMGHPPKRPMEVYYALLKQERDEQKAKGEPEPGNGLPECQCGSGAGNPCEGEPSPSEGKGGALEGQEGKGGAGKGGAGRTEAEINGIITELAQAIQHHAETHPGKVPGSWLRWAQTTVAPAKVPWHQKLSAKARFVTAQVRGDTGYSHSGISRMQGCVGVGVGKPMLPVLRGNHVTTWVIADTSGSMGAAEGEVVLRETAGALKTNPSRTTFGAIDTELHSFKPVRKWQDILPLLEGGGGTDFEAFFTKLEETKKAQRPNVVVFLTDGYADGIPDACPKGVKWIWVAIGKTHKRPAAWGEYIEVDA